MSNTLKFWDRMAAGYAKKAIGDEAAYQHKLEKTQGYLKPSDRVFEFGCGTGGTAICHAPFVQQIIATDGSGKMLEIAKQRQSDAKVENVEFRLLNVDQQDVPDGPYDMILEMSIIHLLADRRLVLGKIYTALEPGGYFVSSTICMGNSLRLLRLFLPIGNWFGLLPKIGFFTDDALVDELEAAGFSIEYRHKANKDAAVFIVAKKVG